LARWLIAYGIVIAAKAGIHLDFHEQSMKGQEQNGSQLSLG